MLVIRVGPYHIVTKRYWVQFPLPSALLLETASLKLAKIGALVHKLNGKFQALRILKVKVGVCHSKRRSFL